MLFAPPLKHIYTPLKVAFITGLSNPASCSLSRVQKDFMSRLELPESYKLYLNFPYVPSQGEENEPLWKASLENIKQYLRLRQLVYQNKVRLHLEELRSSCRHLILLSGSCGLEMIRVGLPRRSSWKSLHVFAYGPVARDLPEFPCILIQNKRDYLSKYYFPKVDVYLDASGHLDYLQNPELLELVQQKLKDYV